MHPSTPRVALHHWSDLNLVFTIVAQVVEVGCEWIASSLSANVHAVSESAAAAISRHRLARRHDRINDPADVKHRRRIGDVEVEAEFENIASVEGCR